MTAAAKAAQRKRRKAGIEEVSAFVNMPKFVAWLIWDGRLKEGDARNHAAIRKALEDFLREQYALMAEEPSAPEYNFRFARGSFGAEFTTLRDRPKETVGILQREGEYDWRDPPMRQMITRRNAATAQGGSTSRNHLEPATLLRCPHGLRDDYADGSARTAAR